MHYSVASESLHNKMFFLQCCLYQLSYILLVCGNKKKPQVTLRTLILKTELTLYKIFELVGFLCKSRFLKAVYV